MSAIAVLNILRRYWDEYKDVSKSGVLENGASKNRRSLAEEDIALNEFHKSLSTGNNANGSLNWCDEFFARI